jgi:hypothetical protein
MIGVLGNELGDIEVLDLAVHDGCIPGGLSLISRQ